MLTAYIYPTQMFRNIYPGGIPGDLAHKTSALSCAQTLELRLSSFTEMCRELSGEAKQLHYGFASGWNGVKKPNLAVFK